MFDVGFQELTLIGVIALIVVGPERLPKMARTIGLWMGKIRYYVGQVKSDIDREVRAQELKEMLNKPAEELDDLYKVAEETKGTLDEAKGALGEAKTAFDSAAASVSTPNEPAAGSIFPDELPEVTSDAESEAEPAQLPPAPTQPPETEAAPSTESPVVAAGPETAEPPEPDEAQSDVRDTSSVAAEAAESDERSSERA